MISRTDAAHRRDEGMQRSLFNANRKSNGEWSNAARAVLERYLWKHPGEAFIGEDVVEYAKDWIDAPPDKRAWGGVFFKASKDGLIKPNGKCRRAKYSNMAMKPEWVAA